MQGRALVAVGLMLVLTGCQPTGPEALLRGDRELQAGHPAEAVRLLELAASKLPAEARVWNRLGLAYHAAGRLPEAQKAYLRALNFDRNFNEAHFNLGELHLESGNPREAEAAFRAYLNAQPENSRNPAAWRGLGQALNGERQYSAAESALGSLLRLDPKDADGWNTLGLVRVQLRHYREAYQAFAQALQLDPKLASAHLNLAVTAQQYLGDRRAALQHYRDYLASHPADAEAIQRVVRDLELKLGLIRPESIPGTNAPAPVAVPLTRPTNNVATVRPGPTNLPPTNRVGAVVRTPPLHSDLPGTSAPPVRIQPLRTGNPVVTPKPPDVAQVPRTSPPVSTSATNPPTVVPSAVKPPLEVVRVREDPAPVPARDVPPLPSLPATRPPDTVIVPTVVTTAAEEIVVRDPGPATGTGGPARKGFWQKVNPVRWFQKDPAGPEFRRPPKATLPATRVTPLEVPLVAAIEAPVRSRPVFQRYEPIHPRLAANGNRPAADAEFQRAMAAHRQHQVATAIAGYRRAVDLDPTYFEAQHNLAVAALEGNDLPAALLASESALALQPSSVNARYNFAVALQRSKHPVDAAEQLEKVVQLRPQDPNAHLALASLYAAELEDAVQARYHYERVLALDPRHSQADNIRRWLERNPAR